MSKTPPPPTPGELSQQREEFDSVFGIPHPATVGVVTAEEATRAAKTLQEVVRKMNEKP